MSISKLENLVAGGTLKPEPPAPAEIEGLIRSGETRLHDAENENLSIESRFDIREGGKREKLGVGKLSLQHEVLRQLGASGNPLGVLGLSGGKRQPGKK